MSLCSPYFVFSDSFFLQFLYNSKPLHFIISHFLSPSCDGAVESHQVIQQSILYTPFSYVERLDTTALFEVSQPIEVELGAGDGSFLIEWASLKRNHNFIGVERLMGRLKKVEKKARRAGLTNVRGIRLEIAYLVEYLLPPGSVSAFHIYFPDPWPKKRHRKNRLIQEPFVNVLANALHATGVVYL